VKSHRFAPPGGDLPQDRPCPLSAETIALLPYSFIELDARGTILRVETRGADPDGSAGDRVVGRRFFQDLLLPPTSDRVGSRYRAMVACESDNRCLATVSFDRDGREQRVQMVLSYYASAGLGYVVLREAP
jgi:hypothetical protein